MPVKYRVIVQEINREAPASPKPSDFVGDVGSGVSFTPCREVFAQEFETDSFDVNALAVSLNKKRRVRKARGKEDKSSAQN